jgi:hypothetical protein
MLVKSSVLRSVSFIIIASSIDAVASVEKPPAAAFEQSAFEFTYQIPPSFSSAHAERGYVPTPLGSVPFRVESWRGKNDSIIIKITVMPQVWWQTRSNGAFAEAKQNLLIDSNVKLIAERDYSVGGCAAHSMVFRRSGDKSEFQRVDLFFVKPDLRVVMYVSPNESALEQHAKNSLKVSLSPRKQATSGQS